MANTTGKKFGGRKKGTPNKMGAKVKETFSVVFHQLQKDPYGKNSLLSWANENPTEFYKIAARFIPLEVDGQLEHRINTIEVVVKE